MSAPSDRLHGARPSACTVQQPSALGATGYATDGATTPLRAAALRVLARNGSCNSRATPGDSSVQQPPPAHAWLVAPDDSLAVLLGELNGLVARLARHQRLSAPDADAYALAAQSIGEALRGLRALAAGRMDMPLLTTQRDDRINCRQCVKRSGTLCRAKVRAIAVDQPRRCGAFEPRANTLDPRSGRQRSGWLREVKR